MHIYIQGVQSDLVRITRYSTTLTPSVKLEGDNWTSYID